MSCLLAFGIFVWPTPWQSYHVTGGTFVRVNRFTGRAQVILAEPPHRPTARLGSSTEIVSAGEVLMALVFVIPIAAVPAFLTIWASRKLRRKNQ